MDPQFLVFVNVFFLSAKRVHRVGWFR